MSDRWKQSTRRIGQIDINLTPILRFAPVEYNLERGEVVGRSVAAMCRWAVTMVDHLVPSEMRAAVEQGLQLSSMVELAAILPWH
jgi:hypothetical protein